MHTCFYYYCKNYDAGVINEAFHPTFEYLVLLALVNFFISHLELPDHIKIVNMKNVPFLDQLMPVNEKNSHKMIGLLLAYSMTIHSTFMVFIYNSTFDYWSYAIILFAVSLQLTILIMCLRIMSVFLSSANVPFYVSAHFMIIKLLIDSLYTNYKMFKENRSVNFQPQCFHNKFFYLFVYILVVCILSCDVAYAADEGPSSPVSESNIFNRISQSGLSQLFKYAAFYETVSYLREWLQEQGELGPLKEELEEAVDSCHTAKERLKTIEYKYSREQKLINKANLILNNDSIKSNSALDINTAN